jgi:hypothetical protein
MPFNQPLKGLIEPSVRSWSSATAADRKALYEQAGKLAVARKRDELARSIGSNGRRMRPRKYPRKDGANGPVLTPHDDQSRTARLMAFRASSTGLTLFWHGGVSKGQRKPWGTILGYHAEGKVRGAPKRDVRLSKRGIGVIRKEMASWWTARTREATRKANAAESKPKPKPGGFSRAQKALIDKYSYLKDYLRPKGKGI